MRSYSISGAELIEKLDQPALSRRQLLRLSRRDGADTEAAPTLRRRRLNDPA
jgi:hypothetical protein